MRSLRVPDPNLRTASGTMQRREDTTSQTPQTEGKKEKNPGSKTEPGRPKQPFSPFTETSSPNPASCYSQKKKKLWQTHTFFHSYMHIHIQSYTVADHFPPPVSLPAKKKAQKFVAEGKSQSLLPRSSRDNQYCWDMRPALHLLCINSILQTYVCLSCQRL